MTKIAKKVREEALKEAAQGKAAKESDVDSIIAEKQLPLHAEEVTVKKAEPQVYPKGNIFDPNLLPESVRQFAVETAYGIDNSPVSMIAMPMMTVLGMAIGRRCGVRVKQKSDWTEYPNFWGVVIAPPSFKKSPTMKTAVRPLRKAERDAHEEYTQAVKENFNDKLKYDIELKEYKKSLAEGKESSIPEAPEQPVRKRFMTQDGTVEAVGELLIDNPHGVLLLKDELSGWIFDMLLKGNEKSKSFWMEAYSIEDDVSVDRIGRGHLFIPHVSAGVFGTIQPDALTPLIDNTKGGGSGGDGFMQRFQLMVMETHGSYKYVDIGIDAMVRDNYYNLVQKIIDSDPIDHGAYRDPYKEYNLYFRFSKEATAVFAEWSDDNHKKEVMESSINPALSAHFGKYGGLFGKLALVLFYCDKVSGLTNKKEIPKEYALKAVEWLEFLESHARAVYDIKRIKEEREEALCEKIINKTKELLKITSDGITFGSIAGDIRGADANEVKKALKGVCVIKGRKVYGFL